MADIGSSQRDAIKQLSPPWLAVGSAERFMYNIGLGSDALLEKFNQAMQARFPKQCDASALPLIGNDRLMAQGPNEPVASFRARLSQAFDAWQRAGARRAVLQQALGYVANGADVRSTKSPIGAIVGTSGGGTFSTWDVFYYGDDTSQPPTHIRNAPSNWDWDGNDQNWQVFLVLYYPIALSSTTGTAMSITATSGGFATVTGLTGMTSSAVGQFLVVTNAATSANNGNFQITNVFSSSSVQIANSAAVAPDGNNGSIHWTLGSFPAIGPGTVWGAPGATWGGNPNISWGLNVSSSYVQGLQALVRLWKSAEGFYPNIIFSFGGGDGTAGNDFSPYSSIGSGNPDGTWGTWAKTSNNLVVPARTTPSTWSKWNAFADGVVIYQNCWTPTGT